MYRSMLEAANEIYAEYISSGENIMEVAQKPTLIKLKNVIENVKKEDFGIASNYYSNAILFSDSNTISYANIHQEDDERFSFGLFFIPKGGFLPLHDHPNMFVFSKILMGKVKRLSFSLSNRNIQFDYPHQLELQKIYIKQQQQQLLMQQRQIMVQKQQQMSYQQIQSHLGLDNNINSNLISNINQNNNNSLNNINNSSSQTNFNQNKKHSPSQFNKQQIADSSRQQIQQPLNEVIAKDQHTQANKSQNQLRQQLLMNLHGEGQKGTNVSIPKGNNNSANDLISISNQDSGSKFQNGQISSSPNLMEQFEKTNEIQIEDFRMNGMNNVEDFQQLSQQQQQQQQLQKQIIQSQQIQQQQISQLQQQQQAIKIDKRMPEFINKTQPQFVEATLDSEEILIEGFIDDLDPFHKNLHYIEAVEDCVFFDVLLPHYDLKKRYCPDPQSRKAILSISSQPINQCKVQYFTIDKSTCNYFN